MNAQQQRIRTPYEGPERQILLREGWRTTDLEVRDGIIYAIMEREDT